jgi:hypothetical protein
MPYIKQSRRDEIAEGGNPEDKGELNYIISSILLYYVQYHGKSYQTISDAIGAAQDAAEEFRRRVLNPYEDEKIKENGDIL